MLALKLIGGAAWTAAYREAIAESTEHGRELLPRTALVFNLTWETIYTLGGLATWRRLTLEDKVQTAINACWLANDIQWTASVRRQWNAPIQPLPLVALGYHLAFLTRYPPGEAARLSAMWQNLGFSAYSALGAGTSAPASEEARRAYRFTLLRAVGTAIPTLTSGVLRGLEPKYFLPGLGCGGFDALRMVKERRRIAPRRQQ